MVKPIFMLLAVLLCGVCFWQQPAAAQERNNWLIDIQPMWITARGFDQHAGDIVRTTDVLTTNPVRITNTVTREPIMNRINGGMKLRGSIQYQGRAWGAGASGWSYSSDNAINSTATSPGGSSIFGSTGISMWKENVDPVENDVEPSGLSPIDFHSNARLKTYSFDFFVFRSVAARTNGNRIDFIGGVKTGRIKTGQNQGFSQHAFVYDFFQQGVHFNNVITLASDARADFIGTGPLIGIQGQTRWRRMGISGAATEALMIGNASQDGVMTDTDEITIAQSAAGPFVPCPLNLALQGCIPVHSEIHFSTSPRVFVPVSEFRFRLQFDLTSHISLSGQGFTAVWGNAPIPPAFTMTHAFAAGSSSPGLDWALQQETLRFAGAGIAVQYAF